MGSPLYKLLFSKIQTATEIYAKKETFKYTNRQHGLKTWVLLKT